MADWVHCNRCYRQPGNNRKFHLTNCGHIYCEECVIPVKASECKICGNRCTTILLAARMKPDVEIFFIDPVDLWKKQFKQMQKIMQVMDFQKNHRSRLAAYNREMYSRQCSMMGKAQKALERIRDLEREIIILKEENSYLKKLLSGKGGISMRMPPVSRSCSATPTSHSSPLMPGQTNKMHFSQQGHAVQGQRLTVGHQTQAPLRTSIRTPPLQPGLPHDPSPKGQGSFNCSSMDITPGISRPCPPLPVICMPITPNVPVTPNYTASSPATLGIHAPRNVTLHNATLKVPNGNMCFRS